MCIRDSYYGYENGEIQKEVTGRYQAEYWNYTEEGDVYKRQVSVRGMDSAELISALSTMNEEDKSNISSYLESKGAWTTELADEQTEEAEEYHIDVRYNMDTDELIDVKERVEQPIDTNLSVMGQAEQLINQLEAEKNIFTSEERNLIVRCV